MDFPPSPSAVSRSEAPQRHPPLPHRSAAFRASLPPRRLLSLHLRWLPGEERSPQLRRKWKTTRLILISAASLVSSRPPLFLRSRQQLLRPSLPPKTASRAGRGQGHPSAGRWVTVQVTPLPERLGGFGAAAGGTLVTRCQRRSCEAAREGRQRMGTAVPKSFPTLTLQQPPGQPALLRG